MTTTNQAAYLTGPKVKPFEVKDSPMPAPENDEIVIRNRAIGINPADWAVQNMGILVQQFPFVLGCDLAGDVYQVGSSVTKFKVGDRVTAMVTALSPKAAGSTENSTGAFQLFVKAKEHNVAKIPDSVTYAEASVLPLCITTAASALFDKDHLGLPLPQLEPKSQGKVFLIWGGSSAVGALAIQLAVAAGFDVATTASFHNLESLRALGAKYVFDRKRDTIVEEITAALKGQEFGGCLVAAAFSNDAFGKMSLESPEILQCGEIAKNLGGNMFVQTVKAPPPAMPLTQGLPEGVKTANGKLLPHYFCSH